MSRTIQKNGIIVSVNTRSFAVDDEYDTRESDGSGDIRITAESVAPVTSRSFRFENVQIDADGDYANWPEDDLLNEAGKMLVRDYIEGRSIDAVHFVGVLY